MHSLPQDGLNSATVREVLKGKLVKIYQANLETKWLENSLF